MTPEHAFILWLSDRQHMVVKRHRPEVRAHIMEALKPPLATNAQLALAGSKMAAMPSIED